MPELHASSAHDTSTDPLETGGTTPGLGDDRVAGRRRVHAVGGPVWGRRQTRFLVEDRLQGDEAGSRVGRDPRRRRTPLIELGKPARVHGPRAYLYDGNTSLA